METLTLPKTNWKDLTHELGQKFAERAAQVDKSGEFVDENYAELKANRFFSAMIPEEFGGGGISHREMGEIIKTIATYCGSTALAFSMHQHLVAAAVWKYKTKGVGAEMLQKVAVNQLVLISTGARDWLDSNGEMKKVDGGYLLSGKKHFASQSIGGDIAVTSAPYLDEVLHFAVPMTAKGVTVLDDWHVMGMRATGSHTILFDEVFIPEASISVKRPKGEFHMVWNVVLTVALPLIMSAYVGIAEQAKEIALTIGRKYQRNQPHMPYMIGKMNNTLLSAQTQWEAMFSLANNFDFSPSAIQTSDILSFKTNIADATIQTVTEAMEAIGGQSFYTKNTLERLFRDVQAAQFHPLPKWDQHAFSGKILLEHPAK